LQADVPVDRRRTQREHAAVATAGIGTKEFNVRGKPVRGRAREARLPLALVGPQRGRDRLSFRFRPAATPLAPATRAGLDAAALSRATGRGAISHDARRSNPRDENGDGQQ